MTNDNDKLPYSVCFSHDSINQADLDCSEVTGSCSSGDPHHFYLHAIDKPLKQTYDEHDDQNRLAELELQIARQQDKIDTMAVENEALRAEKTVLVDELALATHQELVMPTIASKSKGRASWTAGSTNNSSSDHRSMQTLVDDNAKLMTENTRLQVMLGIMRKSFQSYIKDSRRDHDDKVSVSQTIIEGLQQENYELLKLKPSTSSDHAAKSSKTCPSSASNTTECVPPMSLLDPSSKSSRNKKPISRSRRHSVSVLSESETTSTAVTSSLIYSNNSSRDSCGKKAEARSRRSSMSAISSNDKNTCKTISPLDNKRKGVNRSRSMDLLVSFGKNLLRETETIPTSPPPAPPRRPSRDGLTLTRKLSKSLVVEGTNSEELLVDFSETERRRSSEAKRWPSVNW